MAFDLRIVKSYAEGSKSQAFLGDSLRVRLEKINEFCLDLSEDSEGGERLSCVRRNLEVAYMKPHSSPDELVQAVNCAVGAADGHLPYQQAYAIAYALGCENKPISRLGEQPFPEMDATKLWARIQDVLAEEYDSVMAKKAAVQEGSPSALSFTLAGDSEGLRSYLGELTSKQGAPEEGVAPIFSPKWLEDELLAKDDKGHTALGWAVYLQRVDCIRFLLEAASQKTSPKTLKKMAAGGHRAPLYIAVAQAPANLDCILAFAKGGIDFSAEMELPQTHQSASALEILIRKSSIFSLQNTQILKTVLDILAGVPGFDINKERGALTKRSRSASRSASTATAETSEDDANDVNSSSQWFNNPDLREELVVDELDDVLRQEAEAELDAQRAAADSLSAVSDHIAAEDERSRWRRDTTVEDMNDFLAEMMRLEGLGRSRWARALHGRHVETENSTTSFLLKVAVENGGLEAMKLLFQVGADPKGPILHRAVEFMVYGRERSQFFRQGGHVFGNEPDAASGEIEGAVGLACMVELLDRGADVNALDDQGESALHVAAAVGNLKAVNLLLDRKIDVGIRNHNGDTALKHAEACDNEEIVELLTRQTRLRRLLSPPIVRVTNSETEAGAGEAVEETEELDVSDEERCVVCLDNRREVILAPCGHKILCRACTRTLLAQPKEWQKCPVCKEELESYVVQVFVA